MPLILPVHDDTPVYRVPFVTYGLIVISLLIHGYGWSLNAEQHGVFLLSYASPFGSYNPLRSVSAGFLHADIFHLLGNMWFLYLFGSSVEGKMGHHWMGALYLVSLLVSDAAQHLFSRGDYLIALGASGAVGGVLGAYWFLFSNRRVQFFYFYWLILPRWGTLWVGVHWAIAWLFGWDAFWWFMEWKYGLRTGIAHSAHLGGLVCGFACGLLIRQFFYVKLDGGDMLTRIVKWWLIRKGRVATRRQDPLGQATQPEPPSPSPPLGRVNAQGVRELPLD